METFLAIIGLAWAVFITILCFKIWKMCNDVAHLHEVFGPSFHKSFHKAYVTGDFDNAYNMLVESFYNELRKNVGLNKTAFAPFKERLVKAYTPWFTKIGREMPGCLANLTWEKWRASFDF